MLFHDCVDAVPETRLQATIAPVKLLLNTLSLKTSVFDDIEKRAAQMMEELRLARRAKSMSYALATEEVKQSAFDFVREHMEDQYPDKYPMWHMLEDLWDEIITHPGSALVMQEMLYSVERFRVDWACYSGLNPSLDVLQVKLFGMVDRIANAADAELDEYDRLVAEQETQRRERKKKRKKGEEVEKTEPINMRDKRPADVYRRYGLALRYAVEELGNLHAKEVLNRLMLSVTIPVDELENPDWIDGYTGEQDPNYEFIRVRELDTDISDGELPVTLADLMESLGEEGRKAFEEDLAKLGLDTGDYWRQFIQAQRSGVTMAPEADEVPEADEDGFFGHREYLDDDGEKDFEFKGDLNIDRNEVESIRSQVKSNLDQIEKLMKMAAREMAQVRELEIQQVMFEKAISTYKPDLKQPAAGGVRAELVVLLNEINYLIGEIEYRVRETFYNQEREVDPLIKKTLARLPFKYEVNLDKTSLGYLRDLFARKIKDIGRLTWNIHRARFFGDGNVQELIHQFCDWGSREKYEPKNLMAVLLPFQNGFAFREDDPEDETVAFPIHDLRVFSVPERWGGTLHGFLENFGDVYLEQFLTGGGSGIVASCDPDGETLEHWTNDLVADRQRVYLSPKGAKAWRRVYASTKGTPAEKKHAADAAFDAIYNAEKKEREDFLKGFGLKPNSRNRREFVEAEVEASLNGDGGRDVPQQAGWDAYRVEIDPDANREFKRVFAELKKSGVEPEIARAEGMAAFWERVNFNKNAMKRPTKDGIILRNGRVINWGIVKLKLDKHELITSAEELKKLLKWLEGNNYARWFQVYLKPVVARYEVEEAEEAAKQAELEAAAA